jgi:hypothetical protein
LIKNGETHGMVTINNIVSLTAGTWNPIRIQYGDSAGGNNFILSVKLPSGTTFSANTANEILFFQTPAINVSSNTTSYKSRYGLP